MAKGENKKKMYRASYGNGTLYVLSHKSHINGRYKKGKLNKKQQDRADWELEKLNKWLDKVKKIDAKKGLRYDRKTQ